jgi:hypothetical protein
VIQTPQHPQQVLNAVIPKRSEGSASIALASAADSEFPGGPSFAFLAKGGSLCCCLLPLSLIPLVIPSEVPPSLPRRRGISLRSALLAADRTRAAELSLPTAVLFAFFHSKESGFGFGVWTGRASLVLFACNRPHLEAIRFFAQIPVRSAKPYFAVIQRSIFRDEGSLFDLNFLPVPKSKPISRLVVAALAATKKSPRSSFLSRGLLARALRKVQAPPLARSASPFPYEPAIFYVVKFAVDKNFGDFRTLVACSNPYARLINVGSLHARPKNEIPTGKPKTYPIGTLTLG